MTGPGRAVEVRDSLPASRLVAGATVHRPRQVRIRWTSRVSSRTPNVSVRRRLINTVYDRLDIDRLLEHHADDARLRIAPSVTLGVVIDNLHYLSASGPHS